QENYGKENEEKKDGLAIARDRLWPHILFAIFLSLHFSVERPTTPLRPPAVAWPVPRVPRWRSTSACRVRTCGPRRRRSRAGSNGFPRTPRCPGDGRRVRLAKRGRSPR